MRMLLRLTQGWKIAQRHPWLISMLFLYKLVWGFMMYKIVQAIIVPLLYRFPSEHSDVAVQVFFAEAQFQLVKTNIGHIPVGIIAAIFLTRILVTPLLNAGIYYSIERDENKQIRPFIAGVKSLGFSFVKIYSCHIILASAPLYWIIRHMAEQFNTMSSLQTMSYSMLPLCIGYWIYLYVLQLCFMYIQFGKASGTPFVQTIAFFMRQFAPIIKLSCMLLLITVCIALFNLSFTMVWASFISVLLYQLYYLTKAFMNFWEISSQYAIWRERDIV